MTRRWHTDSDRPVHQQAVIGPPRRTGFMILLLQFKGGVVTVPRDLLAWVRCSVVGLVTGSFGKCFYPMEGIETGERMEIQSDQ